MLTAPAERSLPETPDDARLTVTSTRLLAQAGWSRSSVDAQLHARRWRRVGRALVLHNGVLSSRERRRAALINCGSPAALTAFTAAEEFGLHSWERPAVHVLVPGGAHIARPAELLMRVHYVGDWNDADVLRVRDLHRVAPALVLAASTFAKARPACGLLAAGVQQRLVTAPMLRAALSDSPRVRHRHALLLAVEDVAQGAQALSEIDFVRLCRKNGLPEPQQQAVRIEKSGRRRYVDATWLTRSGRRLAVEVDGALHLASSRWWDDQLRQNELVLSGDLVLRFPTVVLRHDAPLVTSQLRRGLIL